MVSNARKYNYLFQYKDHLGNNRISYTVDEGQIKILEEDHYYAFGLKHEGYSANQQIITGIRQNFPYVAPVMNPGDATYKYMYNGKELQDELGLNNYDFGARNYDPAIGRWMNIDPLAELYRRWSPYTYAVNNPVRFIDPDGMKIQDFTWGTRYTDQEAKDVFAQLQREVASKGDGNKGIEDYYRGADNRVFYDANRHGSEDAPSGTIWIGEIYVDEEGIFWDEYGGPHIRLNTAVVDQSTEYAEELENANRITGIVGLISGIFDAASSSPHTISTTAALNRAAFQETLTTIKIHKIASSVGLATGIVGAGLSWVDVYNKPTTGNIVQAVANTVLIAAKINPLVGIAMGIADGIGLSDKVYDTIGAFIDKY